MYPIKLDFFKKSPILALGHFHLYLLVPMTGYQQAFARYLLRVYGPKRKPY